MTPARKKALQWFADRGEVKRVDIWRMRNSRSRSLYSPSAQMIARLEKDGFIVSYGLADVISLTDKGRKALNAE